MNSGSIEGGGGVEWFGKLRFDAVLDGRSGVRRMLGTGRKLDTKSVCDACDVSWHGHIDVPLFVIPV